MTKKCPNCGRSRLQQRGILKKHFKCDYCKAKITVRKSFWSQYTFYHISGGEKWRENWLRIRQEVLQRDQYRCTRCQSKENLHVHHIRPVSKGGRDTLRNLKTLCQVCHSKHHGFWVGPYPQDPEWNLI